MQTQIKTPAEITAMREGGRILATALQFLAQTAQIGMTPKELSHLGAEELYKLGGEAVHVPGYPDIMCISVNEQVQHSIPNDRPLAAGDVVNFDFWTRYHGMVTDAGITVGMGEVSADAQRLIDGTRQALYAGIAAVHGGGRVGDISAAVEAKLNRSKLGIVRDLMGHGVGHELHEEPGIMNYGRPNRGPILQPGMTICIEPIATLGKSGRIFIEDDDWTLVSADGTWSAQWEHTVLVTEAGAEILTQLS